MTETTIEERLADIRNINRYAVCESNVVRHVIDIANTVSRLADVVEEINDRPKRDDAMFSGDVSNVRINDPLDEIVMRAISTRDKHIEELEEKIVWCGTEIKNMHAGSKSAEKWIDTLEERDEDIKTELDIAIRIRHNLKSQIEELRNNYIYQMKRRDEHVHELEAELAARRDDSKVLQKIDIVAKEWNDEAMTNHPIHRQMKEIYDIVRSHYITVSPMPPKSRPIAPILREQIASEINDCLYVGSNCYVPYKNAYHTDKTRYRASADKILAMLRGEQ